MRKLILLILFIFCTLPIFAEEIIYLDKSWDKQASKLLYEYELKDLNTTPEKAFEIFGFKESDVRAVFYDLNSDGVNEIIGYINRSCFWSRDGMALFILKKENGNYENISWLNTEPSLGVYVYENKTFGFCDLKVFPTKDWIPRLAKYNKKCNCYEYFFPD